MRAEADRTRQRIALVVVAVVLLGLVGAVTFTALGRGGVNTASPEEPEEVAEVTAASEPLRVLLVARNTPGDEFTPAIGTDVAVQAIAADSPTGLTDVAGDAVGLYGGTLDESSCDRQQLVDYLGSHPSKADAWAGVVGIRPARIQEFLKTLTPLVLRADTLVTNHGYTDGVVSTFPSVLQSGTTVLVDDRGVPAVRCFCGNPLTKAPDLPTGSAYAGPKWDGFNSHGIVRILPTSQVIEGFEVVDIDGAGMFNRAGGSSGADDLVVDDPVPEGVEGTIAEPIPGDVTAGDATAGDPSPALPPEGEPELLFELGSLAGVSSGPPKETTLTWDRAAYVTSLMTYHYLNEGAPPGTVGLRAADGTMYGPWPTVGTEGQGGVPNAYWTATPNEVVPAGTYTVVDSDPSTWSWAVDTGRRGITIIHGVWMSEGDEAAGTQDAAEAPGPSSAPVPVAPPAVGDCSQYPEDSMMWTLCMHDPTQDDQPPD